MFFFPGLTITRDWGKLETHCGIYRWIILANGTPEWGSPESGGGIGGRETKVTVFWRNWRGGRDAQQETLGRNRESTECHDVFGDITGDRTGAVAECRRPPDNFEGSRSSPVESCVVDPQVHRTCVRDDTELLRSVRKFELRVLKT